MQRKDPKNSEKYYWTERAKMKMRLYGLSGQRVTRVIRRPLRTEEGVGGVGTIAVMQPQTMRRGDDGEKTWSSEIWVMYEIVTKKEENTEGKKDPHKLSSDAMTDFLARMTQNTKQIRIISAWRYPGKTVPGESLPDEIADEIAEVK